MNGSLMALRSNMDRAGQSFIVCTSLNSKYFLVLLSRCHRFTHRRFC
jgi:hypothetical protein